MALDAKCAFDSVQGDSLPEDKRTAVDIASLRADLEDESNTQLKWVPGEVQVADDLTKMNGNGMLSKVMQGGEWCLKHSDGVRQRRQELQTRKKEKKNMVEADAVMSQE